MFLYDVLSWREGNKTRELAGRSVGKCLETKL
jgi:hypothetical protein